MHIESLKRAETSNIGSVPVLGEVAVRASSPRPLTPDFQTFSASDQCCTFKNDGHYEPQNKRCHELQIELLQSSEPYFPSTKREMPVARQPLVLPSSYSSLSYTEIKVSHVPASSPTPTPIIVVTLYRPQKYNAFTDTMMVELEEAFTLFDIDDRVKCIIVTGQGKMFCAGADLQSSFGRNVDEKPREHRDG